MDLDSLIESVQKRTGRPDKDDVAEEGLRFGLKKISQVFPFDQLRTESTASLATGASSLALPESFDEIIELRLISDTTGTSYSMDLRRKTWFVERLPNVSGDQTSGRPYYCYREGDTLYVDHLSDADYTIKMTGFTLGTFGATNETALTNADETLIAYATRTVYESIQMYADAAYWDGMFRLNLSALIGQKSRETGVHLVAEQWTRSRAYTSSQPWLDPFSGHGQSYSE